MDPFTWHFAFDLFEDRVTPPSSTSFILDYLQELILGQV